MQKRLPNKGFKQLVSFLREGEERIYEDKEPRAISWPEYNLAQIEEAKETLLFIKKSVDKAEYLSTKGKVGRPLTDPKVLTKAILVCEFLHLTERKAQGWLEIIGPFVGIHEPLDDRVMGEAYDKPEVLYILKQIFDETKDSDGKLAGDGTGLETSRKQNYESTKNKKVGEYMVNIVDSREIVQAFSISGTQERKIMRKLIEEVDGNSLRLDAGFIDKKLIVKIEELGMIPYVFPKKNNKLNGRPAWKLMWLELFLDVIAWLQEYYQRTHCESFYSSFKRVYGILRKIRFSCRLTQVTARIILHNFRKLSYFNRIEN